MSDFRQTHSTLRNETQIVCYCVRKVTGIKGTAEHNLGVKVTSECTGLTLKLFFISSQRTGAKNS